MLENFNELVEGYKAAHDAGEDTSVYALAISACREWNQIGEDVVNCNVVHAVHEFAHMLAQDPNQYMHGTADEAVSAFFTNIAAGEFTDEQKEALDNGTYTGMFVPTDCENATGPAFARSLLRQADFEDLFAKFDELHMTTILKNALKDAFNKNGDGPQVEMHLLSGESALEFLRNSGISVEYAASGETSGPVAHNDNGAEERD